jgi:hypothetical protein
LGLLLGPDSSGRLFAGGTRPDERPSLYPLLMRPSIGQILAASALVVVLGALVVIIVVATIPPGGPPTLR